MALRVDAVLIGSLATPPVVGTGPAYPSAIADRLVGAWRRGDAKAFCAELHPRLRLQPSIFGADCEIARSPSTADRVTAPGLDGWSADGTAIVAVRVQQGNASVTMHHVVTPLATGYVVTGLFFDFDDVAALLLRPI